MRFLGKLFLETEEWAGAGCQARLGDMLCARENLLFHLYFINIFDVQYSRANQRHTLCRNIINRR